MAIKMKSFFNHYALFCIIFPIFFFGNFGKYAQAQSWNKRLLADVQSAPDDVVIKDVKNASNLDVRDRFDNTPLIWAVRKGRLEVVQLLIKSGADINATNRFGATALMWSVMTGHKEIVRFLLEKNANPNIHNIEGDTSLIWAAKKDHQNIAQLLLENGAHLNATNANGLTARAVAQKTDHQDMVNFFDRWKDLVTGVATATGGVGPFIARYGVDKPTYQLAPSKNRIALVIGVEKYQHTEIAPAEFAVRDAQAMKRHLLALGFESDNIIELLGNNATRASFHSALKIISNKSHLDSSEKTIVFVYFSGHGAPDLVSNSSYILPWDGDPSDLRDTGIRLSDFYESLLKIPSSHVILAIDACFSGAGKGEGSIFGPGKRPLMVKVRQEFVPTSGKLIVISAAKGDEMAGPKTDRQHGLFTYYFLRGINGSAVSDGHVSIESLFNYIHARVRHSSEKEMLKQVPVIQPEDMNTLAQIKLR